MALRRKDDGFFDDLVNAPWWVSLIVASVGHVGLGSILPGLVASNLWLANHAMADCVASKERHLSDVR
jgi:hypothetical protein